MKQRERARVNRKRVTLTDIGFDPGLVEEESSKLKLLE